MFSISEKVFKLFARHPQAIHRNEIETETGRAGNHHAQRNGRKFHTRSFVDFTFVYISLLTFDLCCSQVTRLETQMLRYKTSAEDLEKAEEELKSEKRKLQIEVTDLLITYVEVH